MYIYICIIRLSLSLSLSPLIPHAYGRAPICPLCTHDLYIWACIGYESHVPSTEKTENISASFLWKPAPDNLPCSMISYNTTCQIITYCSTT